MFKVVGVAVLWALASFLDVVEPTYVGARSEVFRDNLGLLDDIDVMDSRFGRGSKALMGRVLIGSSRGKR